MLLERVGLGRLWSDSGPTPEAQAMHDGSVVMETSARQRIALLAAWTIWDGSEACALAESLASLGHKDPIEGLRDLLDERMSSVDCSRNRKDR